MTRSSWLQRWCRKICRRDLVPAPANGDAHRARSARLPGGARAARVPVQGFDLEVPGRLRGRPERLQSPAPSDPPGAPPLPPRQGLPHLEGSASHCLKDARGGTFSARVNYSDSNLRQAVRWRSRSVNAGVSERVGRLRQALNSRPEIPKHSRGAAAATAAPGHLYVRNVSKS
jgi:hypothetical protein